MANVTSFETLVDNINTELNALSITLKTAGRINRAIPFEIVEHYQDAEGDKEWSDTVKIDGIATRLTGGFNSSQTYQGYSERMVISFDAFTNDANDMDLILNEYASQNSGKLISADDWVYFGTFEKPSFVNRSEDRGEQRITVFFEVVYQFVFKGIIADNITIKINTVEVPVLSYASKVIKEGPTTPTKNTSGKAKARFKSATISKTIKFIHVDNAQLTNLLTDIDTGGNINRTYSIEYTIDTGYTSTDTYVMSDGTVSFAEGQFQTIEATFLLYLDV